MLKMETPYFALLTQVEIMRALQYSNTDSELYKQENPDPKLEEKEPFLFITD